MLAPILPLLLGPPVRRKVMQWRSKATPSPRKVAPGLRKATHLAQGDTNLPGQCDKCDKSHRPRWLFPSGNGLPIGACTPA